MPNITIQWYAGRTQDQKRQLTAAITEAMVKIGKTTPDQVHIVFQDVEKSNWGWNGKLASDEVSGACRSVASNRRRQAHPREDRTVPIDTAAGRPCSRP